MIIGSPAKGRRGLPGNLVEEYRAGMIATASPFTGFQPIATVRGLSNVSAKGCVLFTIFQVHPIFRQDRRQESGRSSVVV
jgi:hypothetical protein